MPSSTGRALASWAALAAPSAVDVVPPEEVPQDAERGSAIVEFVFLAVLLMVPVAYLILTVGALQGGSYAVVGAADQAAKVFVLQSDEGAARQAAEAAVALALTDMGLNPADASLTVTCDAGCLTPGTMVHTRVTLRVALPLVGGLAGPGHSAAEVQSTAAQKVGRFK